MELKYTIACYDEIWLGRTECTDASAVSYLAGRAGHYLLSAPYALISGLDSGPAYMHSPTVAKAIEAADVTVEQMNGSMLMDGISLFRLIQRGELFFGFDEIWLCDSRPMAAPGEQMRVPTRQSWLRNESLNGRLSPELKILNGWMKQSQVYTGISDGLALEFITRREEDTHFLTFRYG